MGSTPRMVGKPRILIRYQHRKIARIDISYVDRKAPASLLRREGPQQTSVAINDDG